MSPTTWPGSISDRTAMLLNDAVRSFSRHGRLVAPGHQVVAVEAERVLGRGVEVALRDAQHLGKADVDGALRQRPQPLDAGVREVEAHLGLLEQHLEPGLAVALGAGHDPAGTALGEQLPVREVGLVAAQVDVDAAGPRDGSGDAVGQDGLGSQHTDVAGPGEEDLVAHQHVSQVVHSPADLGDGVLDPSQPSRGEVGLESADPVEHVVHPAAGDLLHDGLQLLALAERVEDRGDGAELQRVRADEHQVVEHPVQLGEQGARPHRPLGHLHAEHLLDPEDHAELVGERGEPVVPVREDEDLPVVADLEELLGAAVHVADDRLGPQDALPVEDDAQSQHAVGRRVLRTDVEGHVGGGQATGAEAHGDLAAGDAGPVGGRGHGGQSAVCVPTSP